MKSIAFVAVRPLARARFVSPAALPVFFGQANAKRDAGQVRWSSYNGPSGESKSSRKKVTLNTLRSMAAKQERLTMLTAHDFPSAQVAEAAGIDMILVGDSLAMVAMGMEDTSEVTLDEMLSHCRSVCRGSNAAFVVPPTPSSPP